MAPGPLPEPGAIRRNAPTIPTTTLPAGGRTTPTPTPPITCTLGDAGAAWWEWAWHTPQACAWDDGALVMVARRAQLEDDLHVLEHVDVDFEFLVGEEPGEAARALKFLIGKLKGLAGNKLAVCREMRELDDRLGLTPKGLAALRWKITDDTPAAPAATTTSKRRLTAVG